MDPDRYKHFDTIDHLAAGSPAQQRACAVLNSYLVLQKLQRYDALLVGTVPIAVDIEGSDLDIICCFTDAGVFRDEVEALFGNVKGFRIYSAVIGNIASIVANFKLGEWEVEVFGQSVPVKQQNGYRHMMAEYDLLLKYGEPLRRHVIQLKQNGYKTEPAFAKSLGLPGDPYQALLDLCPL